MGNWVLIKNDSALYTDGVHSDDIECLTSFDIGTKLFKVLSSDIQYYHLCNYRGEVFRVKPSFIKEIPAPKFDFGDDVKVSSKGESFDGKVIGINWHFKKEIHLFSVDRLDGKVCNKYFLERNLQEAE